MQGTENAPEYGGNQSGTGQTGGAPVDEKRGAATAGQGAEQASLGAESVQSVEDALNQALAEAANYKDLYLRAKADGENLRRRAQDDVAKAHKYGIESFAESLLPVKDSLEAALNVQNASLEAYREGMQITLRQLAAALEKHKLAEIAPAPGSKFDPHQHQAISMVPSEFEANMVVSTLQKGYSLADRVLRPALVTVSQGKAA